MARSSSEQRRERGSAAAIATFAAGLLLAACARPAQDPEPAPQPEAAQPSSDSARLEQRFPGWFETCHYGLYLVGAKSGWMRTGVERDPATGEIHAESTMELTTSTDGVVSTVVVQSRSIYAGDPPHALVFEEELARESGAEERTVFNGRGPDGRLGVFAGGQAHVRDGVRTSEALETSLEAVAAALRGGPGTRTTAATFDLERQRDELESIEFVATERVALEGVERELRVVRKRVGDEDPYDELCDEDGRIVVVRFGERMEARLESAERARSDIAPTDALTATSVVLEGFDGDPERLKRLELEWTGAEELLPSRAGQSSRWNDARTAQIVQLALEKAPTQAQRAAEIPDEVRRELQADSTCNSDHPRIQELAREICGDVADPWKRVRKILDWMQKNIEGSYDANHTTALAVLEAKSGDCTEFTALASGLLRAAGVPARRVGGVVLVPDQPEALLGHAWVEVWIGGWIPVDPTFGLAPASCGRVCFGGEREGVAFSRAGMRARVVEQQ